MPGTWVFYAYYGSPLLTIQKKMLLSSSTSRIPLNLILLVFLLNSAPIGAAPVDGYKVVAKYPHSTKSYTEGFFYLDGLFYEGTGRTGQSAVMSYDPKTGKVAMRRDLPPEYF